ncbi:MAG: penicillin-binding transpeptidase domain-containing protein [Patescibacteria group bacterium]
MTKRDDIHLEEILTDRVVEEDLLEVPLTDGVFRFFFVLFLVLIGAVFAQFVNIGIFKQNLYAARALDNMSDVKIEPAPRGIITSRFNEPLVRNDSSFAAFLLPRYLPENNNDRLATIKKISGFLNIDEMELIQKISERDWNLSDRMLLTNNLSQEQLVAFSSVNIDAIKLESAFKRVHETPFEFSHILGFTALVQPSDLKRDAKLVTDDEIGKAGLEAYYDEYLRGTNGREVTIKNALGESYGEPRKELSVLGNNLKTFIDSGLQDFFYKRLKQGLNSLGRTIGAGLAIDPRNGEILALVNIPSFETSDIVSALSNPAKPLFNRIVSGRYNPGSTIKPLVGIAALAENIIDSRKQIYSAGYIELPNPYSPGKFSRFLDWRPNGWVDIRSALAKSSNVYFYEVGGGFENQKGLGIYKLKDWWGKFGLDKLTGVDLIGEENGFLPDPVWKEKRTGDPWRVGDTYNVSIGQGDLLITPLELLNYITSIANGGKIWKPRVMDIITDQTGKILAQNKPEVLIDLTSEISKFLPDIRQGMRDVVVATYGTAKPLADLPFAVAAKTGTAQIENNTKTNAFIVSYAPYENPQIAILVLIENSREGSLNTVPIAKDVLMWYYENRIKNNL